MSEFISAEECIADDRRNGIVSHCVFHCLANFPLDESFRKEWQDKKGVEVCLTFNGREVSLKKFLEEFERQYGWMLAKRAEKILDERMGRVLDAMGDFEKFTKERFRKLFARELGDE
jgi:exonuclease VII small subunit